MRSVLEKQFKTLEANTEVSRILQLLNPGMLIIGLRVLMIHSALPLENILSCDSITVDLSGVVNNDVDGNA